jgi:hypothetical protein
MRRRERTIADKLVWDGRSVTWPSDYDGGIPGGDSNLWMCAEDAGTTVWWHFHRLEEHRGEFTNEPLRLEGCSDEMREILIDGIPYNNYGEDLLEAVTSFAQVAAQTLILDGRITFEIRTGWNQNGDQRRMEQVALVFIPTKSLIYIGSQLFQMIPRGVERDDSPGRIVKMDPKRIVIFRPPRRWRRPLARMRNGLPLIGRSQRRWMNWSIEHRSGEDFKTVHRSYNIQIGRLTAPIGWNARGLLRNEISEFHWVIRELQWQRFCIDVRESILGMLGDAFQRIGKMRGETPQLVWEHLPTIEQVNEGLRLVMSGKTRFDSVLELVEST